MKEGIVEVDYDLAQPFRVWYRNEIIWFAKTKQEAIIKLSEEKKRRE